MGIVAIAVRVAAESAMVVTARRRAVVGVPRPRRSAIVVMRVAGPVVVVMPVLVAVRLAVAGTASRAGSALVDRPGCGATGWPRRHHAPPAKAALGVQRRAMSRIKRRPVRTRIAPGSPS